MASDSVADPTTGKKSPLDVLGDILDDAKKGGVVAVASKAKAQTEKQAQSSNRLNILLNTRPLKNKNNKKRRKKLGKKQKWKLTKLSNYSVPKSKI